MPRRLLTLALFLVVVPAVWAQQVSYQLDTQSKLWVEGKSNKTPEWTVHAEALDGTVVLTRAEGGLMPEEVQLTVTAEEMVSRKSRIMDRLMHNTLQVAEHPEISYVLVSVVPGATAGTYNTVGRLTIAGVTNDVEIPVQSQPLDGDKLRFTGQHPLLMTEFGMDPPSAMFGQLRTADEVVVHFDLVVAPGPAN